MDPLTDLIVHSLGHEAAKKLAKQLVISSKDLPRIAAGMREHLISNQADPSLHDLTDAQCISLAKAVDQALIDYLLHDKAGL